MEKGKVLGIGGVFFKCEDPDKTKTWYEKNLHIKSDQYGHMFIQRDEQNPDQKVVLQWSPMKKDEDHFKPSELPYMINYRVENLDALLEELKSQGVEVLGGPDHYDYGSFAWIMDPEGRKIELWEPKDDGLL